MSSICASMEYTSRLSLSLPQLARSTYVGSACMNAKSHDQYTYTVKKLYTCSCRLQAFCIISSLRLESRLVIINNYITHTVQFAIFNEFHQLLVLFPHSCTVLLVTVYGYKAISSSYIHTIYRRHRQALAPTHMRGKEGRIKA